MSTRIAVALAAGLAAFSFAFGPAPAPAQVYSFATNPQGAVNYSAGAAVAKVAADKIGMQIRVQPTAGSSTYVPLMNAGEVDFGILNPEESVAAVHGRRNFDGKPNPNLRVLAVLFQLPLSVVVPNDSPIRTLADLKGKRLPSGYVGQLTLKVMQDKLLAAAGLGMQDVVGIPVVNGFQGTEAMAAGKTDAATIAPGVAQVQKANVDLAARGGVRFLSIEPTAEQLKILRDEFPMRPVVIQPAPHYAGIVGPTSVMMYSMYLVANDKLPDAVAYKLVRMLHDNRDALVQVTPLMARFDPKAMTEQLDAPWHPGAMKFYGEIKQWPPTS
jgi:TRAP transporter TAXI family solute receptor